MAIVVTSKGTASGSSSATKSSLTIAAGSTVVACVYGKPTPTSPTCSYNPGTGAVAMTGLTAQDNGGRWVRIYYLDNVDAASGGGSVVVSNADSVSTRLLVYEISGLATPSFDKEAGATGRSTTPSSGPTATTSQDDEAVVGAILHDTGDGTWDGTTTENEQVSGTIFLSATKVISAAAACTCSRTGATKDYWAACVATFKASAGPAAEYFSGVMLGMNRGELRGEQQRMPQ